MTTISTTVVIFNLQNSLLLALSLPKEEVFQVNSQNRPVVKSSSCLNSQPREMLTPKPLNTYVTFGFSFSILVFFPFQGSFSLTVCQRYGSFSVLVLFEKQLVLRIVRALSFINLTGWRQRRVTCQQLIGHINTREKIRYFLRVIY